MRVGINARFLQHPSTGSGQNLRHILARFAARHHQNEYILLGPGPRERLAHPDELPTQLERFRAARPATPTGERIQRLMWEQLGSPAAARGERVHLLHVPYFSAPLLRPCPTVVTIHDVITLILPEYRERLVNRLYTALVSRAVRNVEAVIAVSECSARDIHRVLGVPRNRIHVIGNAVDSELRPVEDSARASAVRARLGVPERYVLYLGGFDARKNLRRILEAYASLPAGLRAAYPLVIAGGAHLVGHPLYPDPRSVVDQLGLHAHVRLIGEVGDADKPVLYSGASVFVWPSLYEGFGMPVLEAMACGAPVITSTTSSLPEVAGDAARLVDPTSVAAISTALGELLESEPLRAEMRGRSLARASEFSWEEVAQRTLGVYESVLA